MRNMALTLVHVPSTPTAGPSGMAWPAAPIHHEVQHWQEDEARQVVADAVSVAENSVDGRPQVQTKVVFSAPVPTLADLPKDVDMLVVGCRGQGGLRRTLLGSVSTGLSHCQVAVIHGDAQRPAGFAQAPVLVGIDGSAASESATAIAFDEASWRGVDPVALHAWCDADWPEFPVMEASAIEAAAEDVLAERLAGWQERYPEVTVRRVVVFQRCSSDGAFVTGSDRPVPPPSQTTTRASCDSCSTKAPQGYERFRDRRCCSRLWEPRPPSPRLPTC